MKQNKKNQTKTESIRSKSLKKGDKKLDGPNRPST
ncbi:MAG: acid-soluble spore protein SspM [Bacillota bacterium]|uniref:Spore protein n=1 Tax=Virgibacillus salarius TaxID=447199 RepID=A0A941I8H3_9BACI|nr:MULTISPECIES: spore protein [Bacillaceae]MBR7795589.1 spore protein [Virgibacillus salarius]MCC2251263.1 spore protein [Virgibacillus sp. AGTR]MDY7045944.1 spore protein [Virgibacillus sp. M23]QRZ17050.1 spore protein [Virgibacillus sp. AGTR]WBX79293.1 spore protein [Virgibacillus salarius]